MLDILAITGPIYLTIGLGYLCVRRGLFAKSELRLFGTFVLNLALPALLFNALAQRRIGEILNLDYLLIYGLGSLLVVGLGLLWAQRVERLSPSAAGVLAMGVSCSNSGFVGYPILLLVMAPVAGVGLALNMVVENLFIIPLVLALAERGRSSLGMGAQALQSLQRLARNPMILGLLAGFVVSLLQVPVPAVVSRTINLLAATSAGLSLFVIGGTLVGLPLRGLGRHITPIVVGKLLVHPLCVAGVWWAWSALGLPPLEPALRNVAIVLAAMPMMGIYPILSQPYGLETTSSAAMLLATVVSFFTLSALLAVLLV
jgi:predicted permease